MNFQQKTVLRQKLFDSCSLYLLKDLCSIVLEYAKEFEGLLVDRWDHDLRNFVEFDVGHGVLRCQSSSIELKTKTIVKAPYVPFDLLYSKGERCVNGDQYWFVNLANEVVYGRFQPGFIEIVQKLPYKMTILKLQFWNNELRLVADMQNKMVLVYPFKPLTPIRQLKLHEAVTFQEPRFSPNGKYVFFWSKDATACLYNLETDEFQISNTVLGNKFSTAECGMNEIFIVNANQMQVYSYDFELVKENVKLLSTKKQSFKFICPVEDGLVIPTGNEGIWYYQ